MPIHAVFLDVDGTLVDSNEFHVSAWEEAMRHCGLNAPSRDDIRGQIGKGADMLLPSLFPDIDEEQRDAAARHHGEIFQSRYLHSVRPFPHATDLLEMLHAKGRRIILASSAKQTEIDFYIDLLKARPYIEASTTIDDVAASKPAGDIFASALGKVFPLGAAEILAIGDTPYDVTAAAKNEISTIALLSGGFSELALREAGALEVYSSVKHLFHDFAQSPLAQ